MCSSATTLLVKHGKECSVFSCFNLMKKKLYENNLGQSGDLCNQWSCSFILFHVQGDLLLTIIPLFSCYQLNAPDGSPGSWSSEANF